MLEQHRQLWNVEHLKEHPLRSVAYEAVKWRNVEYLSALESLHTQGVVLINGTVDVPIEDIVSVIGPPKNSYWGHSWDVGQDPMPRLKNSRDSGVALSPSTFLPWLNAQPKLLFLQCIENTVSGGEQVLVDGMKVAYDMIEFDNEAYKELETYPFRYTFRELLPLGKHVEYNARRQALTRLGDSSILTRMNERFMTTDQPHSPDSADEYRGVHRALKAWVARIADPSNKLIYKMEKGDTCTFSPSTPSPSLQLLIPQLTSPPLPPSHSGNR